MRTHLSTPCLAAGSFAAENGGILNICTGTYLQPAENLAGTIKFDIKIFSGTFLGDAVDLNRYVSYEVHIVVGDRYNGRCYIT